MQSVLKHYRSKKNGEMDVPSVVKDFRTSIFVVDYRNRPSAKEVLGSEEYRRLG
jgi:hypothetical protein